MRRPVILASQSPRRKELLKLCVSDFSVQAANIDERTIEADILKSPINEPFIETAKRLVQTLSLAKARTIFAEQPDSVVIGADTVVVHEGKVLGKPVDEGEAYDMLRSYAGKTHSVLTGVSVVSPEGENTISVETQVTFWPWSEQMEKEMCDYIDSGSPMDKAGAYGIQETPSLWVKEINGDYPNVIGLPVSYVNQMLYSLLDE